MDGEGCIFAACWVLFFSFIACLGSYWAGHAQGVDQMESQAIYRGVAEMRVEREGEPPKFVWLAGGDEEKERSQPESEVRDDER